MPYLKRYLLLVLLMCCHLLIDAQQKIYVATNGRDDHNGSIGQPLKTPGAALSRALQSGDDQHTTILLRGGNYHLDSTLVIRSDASHFQTLTIEPFQREKVILSGSQVIRPKWMPWKGSIVQAHLPLDRTPDQLYLNGRNLFMARYPNYDTKARVFHGTAADAISDERVARWKNPEGGYVHALHQGEWGDFHYLITGKDSAGKLIMEGGWQNNRPAPMHKEYRFVENIFEELDAPGEWYYDRHEKILYLYPPANTDLAKAIVTVSSVSDLLHITGDTASLAKHITIRGLQFIQTARSFMLTREPLLRSDWTIYRGGAILLDHTTDVRITDCNFHDLGSNAVFISNDNRFDSITDNQFYNIGANAIAFVGSASAVRSPAFRYEEFVPWTSMDFGKSPKSDDYPRECVATGNLIHDIGTIEKQVAGVQLSMSAHITVGHNTIYEVPRSGINVSEGTWGGHLIEFNDVFNTVLETGDHGAFNSWGRDRYWRPERQIIDSIVAEKPGIELLDVIDPIVIRNNRFQCDHGWDIDLDDGSTNYFIYNNVCLNGGLKLREGYHRTVSNNILVNNSFHPHVWLKNSGDVFMHNIVTSPYAPILMDHWGTRIDSNFFLTSDALLDAQALHLDSNSHSGDPGFVNTNTGDYSLRPGSAPLSHGFRNIDMQFGVTLPSLRTIAAKPVINPLLTAVAEVKGATIEWLGARFKNIESLAERSAAGMPDNHGALLVELPPASLVAKGGLMKGDVIIQMGDQPIGSAGDLLRAYQRVKWMGRSELKLMRYQGIRTVSLIFK